MTSMRSLIFLIICLSILMSLCPLNSANSASTSLWGKKLEFDGPPCLWQLHPEVSVPALTDLSICIRLKRTSSATWTGFLYRSKQRKELGIEGNNSHLKIWHLGKQYQVREDLSLKKWYSICLTWSGKNQRLKVYLNGHTVKNLGFYSDDAQQQLAQNGTLTLGVSHNVLPNGELRPESGNNLLGEIGLFRMWGKEWSAEEVSSLGCADGDVVSWDLRQWKNDCPPVPDNSLTCGWSNYKIKMWVTATDRNSPENCSLALEGITRNWLMNVFPNNISVHDIYISSESPTCQVQPDEDLAKKSNRVCRKCFGCEVYVSVDPAADVKTVQTDISAFLSTNFSFDFVTTEAVQDSIAVLPAVISPHVTEPPPTIMPPSTTSETTLLRPKFSTTGEPVDRTVTVVMPDQFFRVNLTLLIKTNLSKPTDVIEEWLQEKLEANNSMSVVNLIIKEGYGRSMGKYTGLVTPISKQNQYNCTFHVQEYHKNNVGEVEILIRSALTSGSFAIQTTNILIKHIEPKSCLEEDTSSLYGQYIWPETFPQVTAEMGCRTPVSNRAYRLCKLNIETDTTCWEEPNMTNCDKFATISDLSNITVTPDNAAAVVDIIRDLVDVQLSNNSQLSSSELGLVMEKLSEVVDVSIIEPKVGADIVNIVANILLSETDVTPVADIVLHLTDQMGNSMEFQGESTNIKSPALALSMINVDPEEFSGLTFGVSLSSTMNPEIFVNQSFVSKPLAETNAAISLPAEINSFFPPGVRNTTRVQFHFYGAPDLFQDPYLINETDGNWTLNSFVVSASVNNSQVINLKERVVVTFKHEETRRSKCVFWAFQKYGDLGGWSSSGCETRNISHHQTSCLCDHLTHFGVLLDVSRGPLDPEDDRILSVISYLGCGVSSIFLGITLLTYLIFEKLRQDYPSKILINLSTALLGLTMLFLIDSWLSSFSNYALCITTAAFLHYFLLASCTWMGLEAFHMYFALVKVFNTYVPAYLLKFCAVGWGIPLVIVSLVLAIDKDAYGSSVPEQAGVALKSTDQFCWIQNNIVYYVTVVGFILLIFLGNMGMFIVVLIQIKKMRANKPLAKSRSALQDFRAVAGLTVLLGLTWSLGFFSFGPLRVVLTYLFAICNSFQGFFVFLFHCLMKENVRKQWKSYFCCGRFRVNETSDWSRSVTMDARNKKAILSNLT
ncbi:adhesion G-protein coupled receptor G6-like [Poeciliopsis prolifica]|uniref:adhesion G-protein coupled receptor G6-like n=1 Tax=Poeciliopsis prolifica TaxID=188132 RepID=UPI002413030B|nr:adhesion G-protein coupled receptor G6-like [Poeciliopsis prolifica]XP_054886871.1 adhesion G-protein coupled receptor G6-like [Poeciliopsis prolifica]